MGGHLGPCGDRGHEAHRRQSLAGLRGMGTRVDIRHDRQVRLPAAEAWAPRTISPGALGVEAMMLRWASDRELLGAASGKTGTETGPRAGLRNTPVDREGARFAAPTGIARRKPIGR